MSGEGFFKKSKTFEERKAESTKIKEKYNDRIPVIVEMAQKSNINNIDKHKFLVPADLTIGQFIHVIRKRIKATPEKAIFIFVAKRILPSTASLISTIYEQYADDDGFLYILYSGENTFGM